MLLFEKSRSKAQQRLMGQAYGVRKFMDSKGKEGTNPEEINAKYRETIMDLARNMSKEDLEEFASTKHKGLPEEIGVIEEEKKIPIIEPYLDVDSNEPAKKTKSSKLHNLVDYRDYISNKNK